MLGAGGVASASLVIVEGGSKWTAAGTVCTASLV